MNGSTANPGLETQDQFGQVPVWVMTADISSHAVRVFAYLFWAGWGKRPEFPSKRTIGSALHMSESTVVRAVRELREIGALSSRPQFVGGQQVANVWLVNRVSPVTPPSPMTPPHVTRDTPKGMSPVTPQKKEREKEKRTTPPTSPPGDDAPKSAAPKFSTAFDTFWAKYPRKVGKIAAVKAWNRVASRDLVDAIIAGTARFAADPNRTDEFTPHPATWLTRGSWDDDPLPPRAHRPGQVVTTPTATPPAMRDLCHEHAQPKATCRWCREEAS